MDSERDAVEFYDDEASQYDLKRYQSQSGHLWNQLQLNAVNVFIKAINAKNPIIMDLACGTGRFAIESAKYASHVYAVDKSSRMLEIAREKCISRGIVDKCTFIQSDAAKINLDSNTVNIVLCINALSHLHRLPSVFAEVRRVLKPNGLFIFNYPNLSSYLFPFGYWITRKEKSILENVYTRWLRNEEINQLLRDINFHLIAKQGLILPTALPMPRIYRNRFFGKTIKNKAIASLCPIVFIIAGHSLTCNIPTI